MPGAANALADHQALRERPVIMAAMRIDRKNLATRAHQQDLLIADVPDQGLGREVAQFNTKCEIRPSGHGLLFSHSLASSSCRQRRRWEGTLYQDIRLRCRGIPDGSARCPGSSP